jgi:periplasmic protein TonB
MKNVTLDDIVFENRNKEFGAYDLRKHYAEHLTKALTIISVLVFLISLVAFKYESREKLIPKPPVEVKWVVFNPIEIKPEKKIEKIPAKAQAPKMKVVVNLPPKPVDVLQTPEVAPPTTDILDVTATGPEAIYGPVGDPGIFAVPNAPEGTLVIPEPTPPIKEEPKVDEIVITSEINPAFPGGMKGLSAFLSKNMQYPASATRSGTQGRVIVQFVVERDGSIAQAKVLKGIGFGCDEEALRVINKMPKWTAGSNNGQKVRVFYTLPILFQLDN